MKISKVFVVFVLLISGITPAYADPPMQVGRINYLSGVVSFAPGEANDEWGAATLNRPITTGDRLWADSDGRAEMHIGSTAIRISARTSLDVLSLDERGTQLRLAQGSVNVRLRTLDTGDNFEISTPGGAVLLTQPGSYRVIVDPSGTTTTVLVRRGQADMLTGGPPFSIRENQLATVAGSSQQISAVPQSDEFDSWSALRDRREDNLAATRYVPQEMTGYEDLDQYGTWSTEQQYGAVWYPTTVSADWAPYRQGHWTWISPWGWTWVDDAPWGFAPSHYGRWIWLRNRWAWAPGVRVARPHYAPALVAFVGGANWSVSVGSGPAVGWVPLGWREPYIPWYRTSPAYVRNVNITHVTNINVINQYTNTRNINNIRYINRGVPSATTVVTRQAFVSGQRADRTSVRMSAQVLAAARVTHEAPVSRPERASLVSLRPGPRLPEAVAAREVVATKAPPVPARVEGSIAQGNTREQGRQRDDRPRVRVVNAQPASTPASVQQPAHETRPAPASPASKGDQQRPQTVRQPEPQQQAQEQQRQRLQSEAGKQSPGQQAQQDERQRQAQQQERQEKGQAEERQRQMQQRAQQEQSGAREQQRIQQEQQRLQQEERQRQVQQRAQQQQQQKEQVQQAERQKQIQQQLTQQEQQREQLREQQQARQNQMQQKRAQQEQQRVQQEQQQRAQQEQQQRARQEQLQRTQQEQQQRVRQEQQQRAQREQQESQQEAQRQLQQQRMVQQQREQRQIERTPESRSPQAQQPQQAPSPRQPREQSRNGDRDK